jgi:PAS domain S-box-containing protein
VRDAPNDLATVAADLLDRAPCGFVSFGNDGCVRLANATLLDMLGFTREELIGRHVEEILTMGTRVFYQTHWFPLLRLHGEAEEIFLQLRPRSGDPIGVLVNGVRHERDGVACYDCVLMEVRERQKFEEELLRARREAERVSAELAAQKQQLEEANRRLEAQANSSNSCKSWPSSWPTVRMLSSGPTTSSGRGRKKPSSYAPKRTRRMRRRARSWPS